MLMSKANLGNGYAQLTEPKVSRCNSKFFVLEYDLKSIFYSSNNKRYVMK